MITAAVSASAASGSAARCPRHLASNSSRAASTPGPATCGVSWNLRVAPQVSTSHPGSPALGPHVPSAAATPSGPLTPRSAPQPGVTTGAGSRASSAASRLAACDLTSLVVSSATADMNDLHVHRDSRAAGLQDVKAVTSTP